MWVADYVKYDMIDGEQAFSRVMYGIRRVSMTCWVIEPGFRIVSFFVLFERNLVIVHELFVRVSGER